jgi:hypothetical protein
MSRAVRAVGEAADRRSDDTGLDPAHVLDERAAEPADVRHPRALPDPDAVVDDASEVLDEMAVEVRGDGADGLFGQHLGARLRGPDRTGCHEHDTAGHHSLNEIPATPHLSPHDMAT